jgi:hypothetical protein
MASMVRKNGSLFFALLAFVPVAFLAGCDWLTGSENVQRTSPFINDLKFSRSSVFCDTEFSASFNYDDPQGDIARVIIARTLEGETTPTEATEAWPDNINQYTGIVSFPLSFTKDVPGGRYRITVWAEDDAGHKSNELSEEILLL